MTDDLDRRLGELLADQGRPDPSVVGALLDGIGRLPRRRAHRWLPAAAVGAIALIGLAGIIALRPSTGLGGPPLPPDPAAFAGDPRMTACYAGAGEVEAAFEMRHARDYQRHLPGMLRSPELEVDDPAFVVIFVGEVSLPRIGPASGDGQIVCVLVGDTPNVYVGVDTTGLQATVPIAGDDPGPASPPPVATATATAAAGPTVEPAPAWVVDLAGQLECDGRLVDVGMEVPTDIGPMDPGATPEEALEHLLTGAYVWLPAGGFERPQIDGTWALHRYVVGGRLKVIAVSTNRFPGIPEEVGWEVVGMRACDPAEFDARDGLTDATTLWLSADDVVVPTGRIFSRPGPGHCGWEDVTFLHFEDQLYLRDPKGVLADSTIGRFDPDIALPAEAIDTGFHTPEWRLFTVSGADAVFVRTPVGGVERWPRTRDEVGCL